MYTFLLAVLSSLTCWTGIEAAVACCGKAVAGGYKAKSFGSTAANFSSSGKDKLDLIRPRRIPTRVSVLSISSSKKPWKLVTISCRKKVNMRSSHITVNILKQCFITWGSPNFLLSRYLEKAINTCNTILNAEVPLNNNLWCRGSATWKRLNNTV